MVYLFRRAGSAPSVVNIQTVDVRVFHGGGRHEVLVDQPDSRAQPSATAHGKLQGNENHFSTTKGRVVQSSSLARLSQAVPADGCSQRAPGYPTRQELSTG